VRLNQDASKILDRARIGMLALHSGRVPLVNPAAFSFASGSLWMTTSRFAAKTVLAKRDPRAAFFVDGGDRAVLLRGVLEVFDPLSVGSQIRALLGGPAVYLGMTDYAWKNASFVAGYLLDMARIPREWLPYNRGCLDEVPADDGGRHDWLAAQVRARLRRWADRCREPLARRFGAVRAERVEAVEAFEACEYGAPLDDGTWQRLFGFLPAAR